MFASNGQRHCPLESGYTPDYEQLIKRYFELLQEQKDGKAPGDTSP